MTKNSLGMEFWVDYSHLLKGHPKCGVPHGHTAKVIVEIEGDVSGGSSYKDNMLIDFHDMKETCWSVLEKLDHQDLNQIFEYPTAENITQWIFGKLDEKLQLSKVTFFEGEGKWCSVEK